MPRLAQGMYGLIDSCIAALPVTLRRDKDSAIALKVQDMTRVDDMTQ